MRLFFPSFHIIPNNFLRLRTLFRPSNLTIYFSLLLFVFFFSVNSVFSATLLVTTATDTNDGKCDATCSLRDAITTANASAEDDVINFDPNVFSTSHTTPMTFGHFPILNKGSLTINGPGSNLLTLDGFFTNRIFSVFAGSNVTISGLTMTKGRSFGSGTPLLLGGALYIEGGTVVINNSVISNSGATGSNNESTGGGIYNAGSLTINGTTISGNASTLGNGEDGGGIYNASGSTLNLIDWTGANNSSPNGEGGGIFNQSNVTTMIAGSTVTGNLSDNGGGIFNTNGNLNISNSTVSNNINLINFSLGGGIRHNGGLLTITSSTFSGNKAAGGAGLAILGGNGNITNSTFNDNAANNGNGGGILNTGSLTVTNTTITQNTVVPGTNFSGGFGGGIFNGGNVTMLSSTVSGNSATSTGGGVANNGTITSSSCIYADNTVAGMAPDFAGNIISLGYNLIENTTGTVITGTTTGNILGQDPQLLPLRNNGGTTLTMALRPSSPAIDGGSPDNSPPLDQRGISRPQDGDWNGSALADIGAYERQLNQFLVSKPIDTNDGVCDADCSLREAINATNSATTPDNLIVFDPSIFNTQQSIILTSGRLNVTSIGTLAIAGSGANLLSISGNNQSGVISFGPGTNAAIDGLTIANGQDTTAGGVRLENTGSLTIKNSVIVGNRTTVSNGGGVNNSGGTLNLTNTAVRDNAAEGNGGGIYNNGGSLNLTLTSVTGNFAKGPGGGIYTGGSTVIQDTAVSNNTANNAGGGINNFSGTITVSRSTISNNVSNTNTSSPMSGGGIFHSGELLTVVGSIISNNEATGGEGGGIANGNNMSIIASLLSYNKAKDGGGVYNGFGSTVGSLTIRNSTISTNSSTLDGGGIYNNGSGTNRPMTLTNVTIAENSALRDGGGAFSSGTGAALRNTLIADNTGMSGPDFLGSFVSQGSNLIEIPTGFTRISFSLDDFFGQDSMIDPRLALNGGTIPTHALRVGSLAVDKGLAVSPQPILTDQRSLPRPVDFPSVPNISQGNGSDIGSFERQVNDVSGLPFAVLQGRVVTPDGAGLRNATVSLIDPNGSRRSAITNSFGFFSFGTVPTNVNYTISVISKRFRFNSQRWFVDRDLTFPDFIGIE